MSNVGLWTAFGAVAYMAGLASSCIIAAWLLGRRLRYGRAGWPIIVALGLTAVWAACAAWIGVQDSATTLAETARNLGWLAVLYRLFADDKAAAVPRPMRLVVGALVFVELLQPALLYIARTVPDESTAEALIFDISALFRLMFTVGGLALLHNLYAGAAHRSRLVLRWPATAIALLWLFDLNFYTIAYLAGEFPLQLAALRGLVAVAVAGLAGFGAKHGSETFRLSPSRTVAFQSASLLLIGAYLVLMFVIAQLLGRSGSDFAEHMQAAFVICASIAALLLVPSRKLRGWIKVKVAKHLFQHRYDYRAEWLRFTRTVGRGGEGAPPLQERVIQAITDITESAAGLLLVPNEDGDLVLAARWQWPTADVPAPAISSDAARWLERENFIVDLEQLRAAGSDRDEELEVPQWLRDEPNAWAVVPLLHYDRLVGAVILSRPPLGRLLDWEDFDLLRVVGQQLASYLAESAGQEALAEAGRFDEFNRRIAFVIHDIKNLASQMGLLASNAEQHAENPEFRADMLVTLRNSAERLNALLARLSRYGASMGEAACSFALDRVVRDVAAKYTSGGNRVVITQSGSVTTLGNPEALEQALVHLVHNAIEASGPEAPVFMAVSSDGLNGLVEVVDSGHGMSPEFVRTRLFKPFASTKQGGFGIGAYEARELVRSMGGRLDVESREGIGTRFVVRIPIAAASELIQNLSDNSELNGRKIA